MKKNFLQILFLAVFLLALGFVPVYWFSRDGSYQKRSYIEGRNLATFHALSYRNFKSAVKRGLHGNVKQAGELFFNQFFDRSFQKEFEKAAADQFPFRMAAILTAKGLERGMINLTYHFLDDAAIPADAASKTYVTSDSSRLIYGMSDFSAATKASIDKRIKNYSELIHLYPYQKFYLFYFQRLIDSEYHPLLKYSNNPDSGKSFQYFKENKPEGLLLGDLMLSGMDDHIRYFYSTDHHWNIRGACRAYREIYKMLAAGYPSISPALKCDEFIAIPNVMFLGSLARKTLYPVHAETFEIAKVTLPPYRVKAKGKVTYYDNSSPPITINSSSDPYRDLYLKYFGPNIPLEEYIFDNGSHRNAIIIGNSFINPIQPYLAYHYNHTYFVDLRGYEKFSLGKLLEKYKVDDVIVIGDNQVALTDKSWIIKP